jgi:feruloyl esterase
MGTILSIVSTPVLADACQDISRFKHANVSIDAARHERSGAIEALSPLGAKQSLPVPHFCRVSATLRPSPDSEIKIEVWLPQQWNTKLLSIGNGGWSGAISHGAMVPGLERGYAVTATDTGHVGSSMDGSFAYKHPEKLIDFGWRAVHEMTLTAKAIVDAYYAPELTKTYWQGCSSGGKQGLKEAQMFPADYDGIIAGAPAIPWTRLSAASLAAGRATLPIDSASYLSREKLKLLNDTVIKACDELDRVKDGLLEDPRACTFEPRALQCAGEPNAKCLSAAQVAAAEKIYSPLLNPRTNEYLFAGFAKGSELAWNLIAGGPKPLGISNDYYRFVVFENPEWNYRTLDFDKDVARADAIDAKGAQLNAADPNLDAFRKRGGKLLMYHGWSDGLIPAQNSIDYFEAVLTRDDRSRGAAALERLQQDVRLFMVPGMGHCGGGGADKFDALEALERWVEAGQAPETLLAEGASNEGTTRRPLCVYPRVASYKGRGDPKDAASFECK